MTSQTESGSDGARVRTPTPATDGELRSAFGGLDRCWAAEGPPVAEHANDLAQLHLVAGNGRAALDALLLALRGRRRSPARTRGLLEACVRAEPSLWRRALSVAFAGGTAVDRVRATAAVVGARIETAIGFGGGTI